MFTKFEEIQTAHPLGGSIALNQVAHGTAPNVIGGDAGFTYDPATKVMTLQAGTGVSHIFLGDSSFDNITAAGQDSNPNLLGSNNTTYGRSSGLVLTASSNGNCLFGRNSGAGISDGVGNVMLGHFNGGGGATSLGDNNIFIGNQVHAFSTFTGDNNTLLENAFVSLPSTSTSNYLSIRGTIFADTSSQFVRIRGSGVPAGPHAFEVVGDQVNSGTYNGIALFLDSSSISLSEAVISPPAFTTLFAGPNSGAPTLFTGQGNCGMGAEIFKALSTGGSNTVFVNFGGAATLTTGSNNSLFGDQVDTPAGGTSNHLNIDGVMFADTSSGFVRFLGSGVVAGPEAVRIVGDVLVTTGRYLTGIDEIYIGPTLPTGQGLDAIAIGFNSGTTNQGSAGIAIGDGAGTTNQGADGIAIGRLAGEVDQLGDTIAIGERAGRTDQGSRSIAIGREAGSDTQDLDSIAIGYLAGTTRQIRDAIAIGRAAGNLDQKGDAISIGVHCGEFSQSQRAIALGDTCGETNQGTGAVAIGRQAGRINQGTLGMIIATSGVAVNDTSTGHIIFESNLARLSFTSALKWNFAGGDVGIPDGLKVDKTTYINGALKTKVSRTAVTANFTSNTVIMAVTSTAAERTITLLTADIAIVDKVFIIKDESFAAGTNNIIIVGQGGQFFDDGVTTSITISVDGGVARIYSDGTNLFTF